MTGSLTTFGKQEHLKKTKHTCLAFPDILYIHKFWNIPRAKIPFPSYFFSRLSGTHRTYRLQSRLLILIFFKVNERYIINLNSLCTVLYRRTSNSKIGGQHLKVCHSKVFSVSVSQNSVIRATFTIVLYIHTVFTTYLCLLAIL